jgi:hypothetical protein
LNTTKRDIGIAVGGYAAGILVYWFSSAYIALLIPTICMIGVLRFKQRNTERIAGPISAPDQPVGPYTAQTGNTAAVQVASSPPAVLDPELASAVEYIGIIEDMILLEGENNSLDTEIVQKTLALLTRLNRLVPDLVALGDSSINHNIVRLVKKDLNSTINPFLRLSGEAKRQNRRLLLDGIKDIDAKLTSYTKTIEQKDLIELRTKAELIHQRYRIND